jgi:hypothetical protein
MPNITGDTRVNAPIQRPNPPGRPDTWARRGSLVGRSIGAAAAPAHTLLRRPQRADTMARGQWSLETVTPSYNDPTVTPLDWADTWMVIAFMTVGGAAYHGGHIGYAAGSVADGVSSWRTQMGLHVALLVA